MMWKILSYVFSLILLGSIMLVPISLPVYAEIDCTDGRGFGCTDHVKDVKVHGTEKWPSSQLLTTIKTFINWMLGLLATIALVLCLYGGFLMVTAAGDDTKQKKGMTILKQAGIGIIIIGLSRWFVSLIFWIISVVM